MTIMTRKCCVFCGGPLSGKSKAREHVFPSWLLEELDIADDLYQFGWLTPFGRLKNERQHVLRSSLLGFVCVRCNGGWMSQLESRTKAIFLRALDDNVETLELTHADVRLLATWSYKTAITLNLSSNYRDLFSPRQVREFGKTKRPPSSGYVDVLLHKTDGLSERQSQQIFAGFPQGSETHLRAILKSFRITMTAGPFTFRVGYSPGSLFEWIAIAPVASKLWPAPPTQILLRRNSQLPQIDEHDLNLHMMAKASLQERPS